MSQVAADASSRSTQDSNSTYSCCKNVNRSEEAYNCGYDFDVWLGPFYEAVGDKEDPEYYCEEEARKGMPEEDTMNHGTNTINNASTNKNANVG